MYPPGLLPAGSWALLLDGLGSHFGQQVELAATERQTIARYLRDNAAERSPSRRSRRILRGLKGETPLRITEIPYIQRKHRRLSAEVFARKSIQSRSKCAACHPGAVQGEYDDDQVKIPN